MLVALPLVGVLLLTGCGSARTADSSETPNIPATNAATKDLTELKARYTDAGFECKDWSVNSGFPKAKSSGSCAEETKIGYFDSNADVEKQLAESKAWSGSNKIGKRSWVVGDKWIIATPKPDEVATKLSGKVVTF
ncbi:hypothetical protein AS189_16450 [Arthrobacter alpinus]|uniref:Lipoprotein n=1 Tax=Arthrobacter alpinus TaxID=656366 RepID=A0A0S2M1Z1_9MICC|nr:hypothetical protein [Arthrobacter alpinus]ALO67779.1 hypothetical protein AS189_16450 [Arthrobacter alpinus]